MTAFVGRGSTVMGRGASPILGGKKGRPTLAETAGVDIARCRAVLGDEASGLSDADVTRVCVQADAVAQVVIELFATRSK